MQEPGHPGEVSPGGGGGHPPRTDRPPRGGTPVSAPEPAPPPTTPVAAPVPAPGGGHPGEPHPADDVDHAEVAEPIHFALDTTKEIPAVQDEFSQQLMSRPEKGRIYSRWAAPLVGALFGISMRGTELVAKHVLPPVIGSLVAGAVTPISTYFRRLRGDNIGKVLVRNLKRRGPKGILGRFFGGESGSAVKELFRETDAMKNMLLHVDQKGNVDYDRIANSKFDINEYKNWIVEGTYFGTMVDILNRSGVKVEPNEIEKFNRFQKTSEIAQWLIKNKITDDRERMAFLDPHNGELRKRLKSKENWAFARYTGGKTLRNAWRAVPFVVGVDFAASEFAKNTFGYAKGIVEAQIADMPGNIGNFGQWVGARLGELGGTLDTLIKNLPGYPWVRVGLPV